MFGLREGDSHVRTGCARDGLLGRGGGIGAAALRAARNPARIASDPADDAAFNREHGAAAQGYEQAALFHKTLNLRQAFPANPARDVVRLRRRAETGKLRSLLEGHRPPGFRDALNLLREFQIDVAVQQYIELVVEIARANVFIANVGVRNLSLVERVAHPSDGVGVCPRNPHAKAGGFCGMVRDVRCRWSAVEIESQLRGSVTKRISKARLRGKNPGTSGIVSAGEGEGAFRDIEMEGRKTVACFEQTFLPCVLQ